MSAKYRQEKSALAESALTVYLCKRMTHAQLKKAMELALNHGKPQWAFLIRFSLAWACSSARRTSDMLNLLFAGMCLHDFREATPDEPLVSRVFISRRGIVYLSVLLVIAGWNRPSSIPDSCVRYLAWKTTRGACFACCRILGQICNSDPFAWTQAGRLEASANIRHFHFELCPIGALADRVVCELSGPRLTLATLAKSHVLRAPGSLGDKSRSSSWFTIQTGQVLRDAGMLNITIP